VRVEVRLYATFADHSPSGFAGDPFDVHLIDEATLGDLIARLGLDAQDVHLFIVNGRLVHDSSLELQADDRVGLFPPVGGG